MCLLVTGGCVRDAKPPVTLESALGVLTNVASFAQRPIGRAGLVSSFDRTGGNTDWDTLERARPDGWVVLADLKGPGILHRIWQTGLWDREVAFFLDGEKEPRIRSKFGELFGKHDPFAPPLADSVSRGCYSYVPIPFHKSVVVAVSANKGAPAQGYYQINYELFDRSVDVVSFPVLVSDAQRKRIHEVGGAWTNTAVAMAKASAACTNRIDLQMAPHAKETWMDRQSGGTLRCFTVRIATEAGVSDRKRAELLRGLVLRMYWDGAKEPSVNVPLGDFFANGLHSRSFASLPLARLRGDFISRFPMPFGAGARAEIVNDTDAPVALTVTYDLDTTAPSMANREFFHAAWRGSALSGAPFRMWQTEGTGHLAGFYLVSMGMDGSWNMLEGDERIWIDGEVSPSFSGTGLEDCFNGAWYYDGLFDLPVHGLMEKAGPQTAQYRFLLPDRISFSKGARMDFEFGDGNRSVGYMSAVAYWYQPQPHAAGITLPSMAQRFPPANGVERAGIMASLIYLERAGLFQEAWERCGFYADQLAGSDAGGLLSLRAAAYQESLAGYESVSNFYRKAAAAPPDGPIAQQARSLRWFHESETNMFLGIQINGQYRLYLDRQLISEGDNPLSLSVQPVVLAPGEHEIAIEITPTRPLARALLYLRSHTANVELTADGWTVALKRPANWPACDDPAVTWISDIGYDRFPTQDSWQFMPNAFAGMQSVQYIDCFRPWVEWRNSQVPAYFRKRWTVPGV
jgi:hypothetical protein